MDKKFLSKLVSGAISTSLGTTLTIFSHFFSIMLLARFMPKEDLGIYFLILVNVHLVTIISGLGLNITLVKFISGADLKENSDTLITILLIRLFSLIVFSFAIFGFGKHFFKIFDNRINDFINFIPVMFFLFSFKELFLSFLQGIKYFKKFAIVQIFSSGIKLLLIISCLYYKQIDLNNLIFIELITLVLTVFLQTVFIPFKILKSCCVKFNNFRKIFFFSFPIYLNDVLTLLHGKISVFIIGAFLSPINVAYYEIADKIPQAFLRVFSSFIVVYFPSLSELLSKKKLNDAESLINKSLIYFSTGILFFVLITYLFNVEIIKVIFSDKFIHASIVFSILMFNFYLRGVSNLMGYSLLSAGYSKISFKVNSISCAANILLSLILIKKLGLIGAAYSLIIMNSISQILYFFYLNKYKFQVNLKKILRPFTIVLFTFILYTIINSQLVLVKVCMIIIYCCLCYIMIPELKKIVIIAKKSMIKF